MPARWLSAQRMKAARCCFLRARMASGGTTSPSSTGATTSSARCGSARISFSSAENRCCSSFSYRPDSSTVRISRVHSGFNRDFVHERRCFARDRGGEIKLRIVLDRFSAEVFVNDGEQALTMTLYTPLTADGISFEAQGNVLIDVEKFDILP